MLVNFTYLFYFFDLFFFVTETSTISIVSCCLPLYCVFSCSYFFFAILLSVVGITTVDDPKIVILGIEFGR